MALAGIDQHLEASESPADSGGHQERLQCDDAATVNDKVENLGQAYNELEERIYSLENPDKAKELQLATVEQQSTRSQENLASIQDVQKRLSAVEVCMGKPTLKPGKPMAEKLVMQQGALDRLSIRMQQIEARSLPLLSTSSTHEIVETLLPRLNDGDSLNPTDFMRLQAALNSTSRVPPMSLDQLPETPSLTDAPARGSAVEEETDEEPPRKRVRSRASTNGRYARNLSSESDSPGFSVSERSENPEGPQVTHSKAKRSRQPGKDHLEVLETQKMPQQPSSFPLSTPKSDKKEGSHNLELRKPRFVSDVAWESMHRNRKRTITHVGRIQETSSGVEMEDDERCEGCQEKGSHAVCQVYTDEARKEFHTSGGGFVCAACRQVQHACSFSRDTAPAQPKLQTTTGLKRKETKLQGETKASEAMTTLDEVENDAFIVPERRSIRTPQPVKGFEEYLSWKEANKQVMHLKPTAP